MDTLQIDHEIFHGYISEMESANEEISVTDLSVEDTRTTLSANCESKNSYEAGRTILTSIQEQFRIDIANLNELAESFEEYDDNQGCSYCEG